jgi:antitoxin VapB
MNRMADQVLHIESAEAVQLANELSRDLGKPVEQVVVDALRNEKQRKNPRGIDRARVEAIINRIASTPVVDNRPADEIIGYNDRGAFD